jgi:hypothetical protein
MLKSKGGMDAPKSDARVFALKIRPKKRPRGNLIICVLFWWRSHAITKGGR